MTLREGPKSRQVEAIPEHGTNTGKNKDREGRANDGCNERIAPQPPCYTPARNNGRHSHNKLTAAHPERPLIMSSE